MLARCCGCSPPKSCRFSWSGLAEAICEHVGAPFAGLATDEPGLRAVGTRPVVVATLQRRTDLLGRLIVLCASTAITNWDARLVE
jgi:hypothetical protein